MKGLKRLWAILLSAVSLIVGVGFVGCDNNDGAQTVVKNYYGIAQTLDGKEDLYVYVPTVGICEMPSIAVENSIVKEGDLLSLGFATEEVRFSVGNPVKIETPVETVTVAMENVELSLDENGYVFTIDHTRTWKEDFLSYEKSVGDEISFVGKEGKKGGETVPSMETLFEYCKATVEEDGERLSLRLHLAEKSIQDFLKEFSAKRIRIQAGFATDKEPLKNFLEIKEKLLDESSILKVETVTYPGSVSPANRPPIEYKTTTRADVIQKIYYWLRRIYPNSSDIVEITERQATVEGCDETWVTVYTDFGTFKICEYNDYLKIWDRYFIQLDGSIFPYFTGDTTTYTFECYDYGAQLYVDGKKSGEYEFAFDKFVCKLVGGNFARQQEYKLKTDIGDLIVYGETHFYRNGETYEIVDGGDFSEIIEDYPLQDDKLKLLISAYESGKESWVKASVVRYYGEFASGAIVAIMTASDENSVDFPSDESSVDGSNDFYVAGHYFSYCSYRILALYNGEFYGLAEAYENGYLTAEEIGVIAEKHNYFYRFNETN